MTSSGGEELYASLNSRRAPARIAFLQVQIRIERAAQGYVSLNNVETIQARYGREKPFTLSELGSSESSTGIAASCVRKNVRVNKFAEVIYKTNRYSVPARLARRNATVEVCDDRVYILVDDIHIVEHERAFGRYKAVLTLDHFIDGLTYMNRGIVLAEVERRRLFYHSLRSLLDSYVETNVATASKRFRRVIALLENHTMQYLYDAIEVPTQIDANDPAEIKRRLKTMVRPYDPDSDSLRVYDTEEWTCVENNVDEERVAFTHT